MIKLVAAVSAAALLAGVAVMVVGGSSQVQAHMYGLKGDRLDLKTYGPSCSERGWPYFEANCLRDITSPTRQARLVRIVTTDRIANR
jgi:hypothetical protein